MNLERYIHLWTKPFYFVLGPLPESKQSLAVMGLQYYPYRWLGIGYVDVSASNDIILQVVPKMLEAGVPIVDPLPNETKEKALEHFWTDRLHEFALIQSSPGSEITHSIYRLNPPEYLVIPITYSVYQDVINKMLAAGAKVLSEVPEPPK